MQSKCVDLVTRKMKPMEVLLDMVPIVFFTSNDKKINDWLAVTSEQFYFIYNQHIKKNIPIANVRTITVSAYSHEIVLHCDEDDVRFSSHQNAKIFKNILKVREQVLQNGSLFTVLVEKEKHLGKFAGAEEKKKSFLSSLFSRHGHENKKSRETSSSSSGRHSYCKLEVTDKTFLHQVSQKIYACHYSDVKLLYISGGYGFFFDQSEYDREEVDTRTSLYRHRENKEEFISRKILKQNEQASTHLRSYLQSFKLNSNKEEILYAIEQAKYFQIISPYSKNQRTLQSLIDEQKQISQIDLVSIFYKLMGVIDSLPFILHSLRPKYILLKDSITVSSAACLNKADTNVSYLAPEELDPDIADNLNPQLINFWKLGVLLYEIAYLVVPFPIEHLAEIIVHNKTMKLTFPSSQRSPQFRHFLGSILQIEPTKRAGGRDWKKDIFQHRWLRQSMR